MNLSQLYLLPTKYDMAYGSCQELLSDYKPTAEHYLDVLYKLDSAKESLVLQTIISYHV